MVVRERLGVTTGFRCMGFQPLCLSGYISALHTTSEVAAADFPSRSEDAYSVIVCANCPAYLTVATYVIFD